MSFQDQQLCSGDCLFMKGEANVCNQDVGKCTFQNVLQIKLCFRLLMFLPHSHVVAVVLFLVLPEVASHVWKSPSVIQRTVKKLGFAKHTSFLFPSSDLNWLSCLFIPTLFPHLWLPRTVSISWKIKLSSALSQTFFYSVSPWQNWKAFTVIQKTEMIQMIRGPRHFCKVLVLYEIVHH